MNDDTREAFRAAELSILKALKESADEGIPGNTESFALAYRYLRGGPQPGSATVESK